jgi:hypothetical protein
LADFTNRELSGKCEPRERLGKRGPYIVNITVINTPPKFVGIAKMSMLKEVSVRLNEEEVMFLPVI